MMSRHQSLKGEQQGMVSIIVTMIIMAILALIVVGFAQLSRREQRSTLDKQLSTQAFYAAESGINDAIKVLDNGSYTKNKKDCTPDPAFNNVINSNNNVSYTCLMIDQTPEILDYSTLQTNGATVIPLEPVDRTVDPPVSIDLTNLDISWNRADNGGTTYYGGSDLPVSGNAGWGDSPAGILRLDIIPVSKAGFSRDNLIDNTFTTFLYPQSGGSINPTLVNYVGGAGNVRNQGTISKVGCSNTSSAYLPHKCKARITNLPTSNIDVYYVRIIPIYSDAAVTVSGENVNLGTIKKVGFRGAQNVIDSTGKAGDVLKRIRVHRKAKGGNFDYPIFTLDSGDSICKLLTVYPGGGDSTGCGITPTPPSNPGGNVNAGFDDGCGAGCTPGAAGNFNSPTDPSRWKINLTNTTSNPGLTNVSCLWDFGDGTTLANEHCNNGDYFQHTYNNQGITTCTTYTVNLTVKFSDGSTAKADPDKFYIPLPGQYTEPCH